MKRSAISEMVSPSQRVASEGPGADQEARSELALSIREGSRDIVRCAGDIYKILEDLPLGEIAALRPYGGGWHFIKYFDGEVRETRSLSHQDRVPEGDSRFLIPDVEIWYKPFRTELPGNRAPDHLMHYTPEWAKYQVWHVQKMGEENAQPIAKDHPVVAAYLKHDALHIGAMRAKEAGAGCELADGTQSGTFRGTIVHANESYLVQKTEDGFKVHAVDIPYETAVAMIDANPEIEISYPDRKMAVLNKNTRERKR